MKIVAQFDRAIGGDSRYGDWTTTKRFLIQKDMVPDAASARYDMGEQNMADPKTLSDFVTWAIATYPADHYFLDLWDHGLGWQGVALDDLPGGGDHLTAPELGQSLSDIAQYLGRPLDILANDACRMTLEIMYEAAPYVNYIVGSEKDEPAEGWPYDHVLGALAADPAMSPIELATTLVDEYVDFYRAGSSYSVTMALVNTSALPQLVGRLSSLVSAVNDTLPFYVELVSLARNESEHYEGNHCSVPQSGDDYDLHDVASNLLQRLDSGRVITAAIDLLAAISRAVLYEKHLDLTNAVNCVRATNAHGLSIWYPWEMGSRSGAYSQLALSRDSLWNEHLASYHNGTSLDINLTASLTLQDRNSDGLIDNGELKYSASANGQVRVDTYLDDGLISGNLYAVTSSVTYVRNISFPTPGAYIIYLTYRQTAGALNITSFPTILVGANITFRGEVRDIYGNAVTSAKVTMSNLRTGEEINATMAQGLYTVVAFYPVWMSNGDTLRVVAMAEGGTITFETTFAYRGRSLFWRDIYLPAEGVAPPSGSVFGSFWPLAVVPLIALALEVILIVSVLRKEKSRRGGTN